MIHINLTTIFYSYVEDSPTKPIYIRHNTHTHTHTHAHAHAHTHTHTHNDCSRDWVLILVRMEILREEEGFQFDFKR